VTGPTASAGRAVAFPSGITAPALGQGCWNIGDSAARRAAEVATLQHGIDLGMTLIDTAEMYGEGASERLVAEAIRGRREKVLLVTKVYPHNAGRSALRAACERSLARLGTEAIDLYLLHWRGNVPLAETVETFERLKAEGKIKAWGVSNFDVGDMEELLEAGGTACATNQILYNLSRRGPEFDLLPWMERQGMPLMAYSPIEQGRLPRGGALQAVAERHGATPAQVALAFAIRSGRVIAIPKASSIAHVEENAAAGALVLSHDDLAALDRAFPPPRHKMPLAML
jgi:diketogulonate reductase-like aldo/keto reductase